MAVNRDKPDHWKDDIAKSVDLYNEWFMDFAPQAYRDTRVVTTKAVESAFEWTNNLSGLNAESLREHPEILPILRMSTCPPLARDRLIGLADLSKSLVGSIEVKSKLPSKMPRALLDEQLGKIVQKIQRLTDPDIFVWLGKKDSPSEQAIHRAATIVADRLCGSQSDPIVRNAQEKRQLTMIGKWLDDRKYKHVPSGEGATISRLSPGSYSFRLNAPIKLGPDQSLVNIPIDVAIKARGAKEDDLPLMVECKSAGDFTNTNKRRKEEATKISQLKKTYGENVRFILFLCGYFDSGYLGYEAAEGIDWVWEHRINDLAAFNV